MFLLSSREPDENHSLNPSSYIGSVLQEITHIVTDSVTYKKAKEQTPGEAGGSGDDEGDLSVNRPCPGKCSCSAGGTHPRREDGGK